MVYNVIHGITVSIREAVFLLFGGNQLGLISRFVSSVRSLFDRRSDQAYGTFTEHAPAFSVMDRNLYAHAQTRAIVERIAVACSKLRPEFVKPDGSEGSLPRVQRIFESRPNDMMSWPDLLRRLATITYVDTTAYVVPEYDRRDGSVIGLWPMKPAYTELVEYEGEPWLRFHLETGDVMAYEFYDVAILTRFQLESDVFGGGNQPLTPTLRLMDAQRQAEQLALQTGADIRFIGKLSGMVHESDMEKKRDRFSASNLGPANKSALMVYDQTWEDIHQLEPQHFTIDPDEMERIDKALYTYFGINEKVLTSDFDEHVWNAFYENVVEPFGIMLGQRLTMMLLTPTQMRKGNHVMFSSGYLEYASVDSKIKVANLFMTAGIATVNEVRDIFQLPRIPGGDVRMVRGEYYVLDLENNIIAESGGRSEHDSTNVLPEPDWLEEEETT